MSVFGEAFSAHGGDERGALGHIWAVFDGKFYRSRSVSVEESSQLLKIGRATDFGVCKAVKRDGDKCTKAVNVSECKFCEFHVPKAIKDVANASRVMTGKRNAEGEFKVGLQKYGAAMQPLKSGTGSRLARPGEGALSGAPPPSARAKQILKQSNVHVPRAAFQSKREFAPARKTSTASKTMALYDEDEFEDDEATLEALAKEHASSIAQLRKDKERAKQRAAAERLKASGLTLTKTDPNDTSAKKPTAPVVAKPKPLPDALKSYGLQTVDTVEQLQKKLKAEIVRRKELEAENEELRRQLAEARGDAPPRPAMRDVSNSAKASAGTKQSGAMSKTQMLFGHVGAANMKSRYEKDADAEDDEAMMKRLDTLEERDQLAAQLAKKMETKVKVYHCTVCKKKTRFIDRDTCGAHMHAVKLVDATMRYFKCKACNQTNTSHCDAFMPTAMREKRLHERGLRSGQRGGRDGGGETEEGRNDRGRSGGRGSSGVERRARAEGRRTRISTRHDSRIGDDYVVLETEMNGTNIYVHTNVSSYNSTRSFYSRALVRAVSRNAPRRLVAARRLLEEFPTLAPGRR